MGRSLKGRTKLNKLPSVDTPLLTITIVLVVFGLIMMYSASFAYAYYYYGDSFYFIKDQVVFAIIGFVAMYFASRINYRIYHKLAMPLYILTLLLLVATLFMPARGGAHRWIILGSFQFQPSEIAKFAIILLFSHLASINYDKMKKVTYGFLQFMAFLALYVVVMIKQPHVSGTILILLIGMVVMFIGGTRVLWFGITGVVGVSGGLAYLLSSEKMGYAKERLDTWLHPFSDPLDGTFQSDQSLIAIGSGGLLGRGLGNSVQKYLYVPEPQNDFIFAIICEELGFIGAALLIFAFMYFVYRGIRVALLAKDKFGALLATGITAQIGLQAALNIGVVTNTIPNTGISLPFFSYGGTSLVILLAEVGVLLSISRYSKVEKD